MQRAGTNQIPTWIMAPVINATLLLGVFTRRRQMKISVGGLSEAMLRDIGLTPEDVEAALGAPLDQDASDAMLHEAVARAGNW
ncbi:DUF1127 domain-containing protein [Tabrizicola sp.]|uniref:DUF1127 domain-containing protein n=1 Tax=Tabrizicola sp. TaxID=2005166 RepID=UPI0035AFD36F